MADKSSTEGVAGGQHRGVVGVVGDRLSHQYDGVAALEDVSLEIHRGEFMTLLGPSGSGKSTFLHIVAGLVRPSDGRVRIDGRDVTDLPPQHRDIGLVFQNYALFPHMNVRANIAFPLRVRGRGRREVVGRVDEVLELVELTALSTRFPAQLSGGQQQRVAIGRAIAAGPRVLLLDEPLGALDRRLRQQLGGGLRRIQRETHITTIYVTHDQEEAFSMSDRIAVMHQGKLRQVGTPSSIYRTPVDEFVAAFVGEVNILDVALMNSRVNKIAFALPGGNTVEQPWEHGSPKGPLRVALRPENVVLWPIGAPSPDGVVPFGEASIIDVIFQGSYERLVLEVAGVQLQADTRHTPPLRDRKLVAGCQPESLRILGSGAMSEVNA